MKIYTNDIKLAYIIKDLFPGSIVNKHFADDLAIINTNITYNVYKTNYATHLYFFNNKNNSNYKKILCNKIKSLAHKYQQEYINDINDEIFEM